MNPYVFFVGCPRSGTTLLRRIGDAHPELAIAPELHWLARWWERRTAITPDGFVTPELVDRLVAHSRFPRLEVGAERVAELVGDGRPKHYARFITELFDLYGQAKGKRLVGSKTPQHVLHLSTLHELWPHAKVVHLIRDGRDVAMSLLDWDRAKHNFHVPPWDEDPVMAAALFWERHVRLGREAAALLDGDRYYELRYESLVADPELECRRLCHFLGLEYDPAMLRFHEERARLEPGLSPKKAWLPVTRGLRSWRQQMASGAVTRFEAAASDLLGELGYELAASRPAEEHLMRALRLRDASIDRARAKGQEVPRAWEAVCR